MGAYIKCLGRYVKFNGRASRAEFWGYSIVNLIIVCVLVVLQAKNATGTMGTVLVYVIGIYALATLLPTLAVMSRRWHDLGRTGLWVLLNLVPAVGTIVSLCFFLGRGESGRNEYGRDPRRKKHE